MALHRAACTTRRYEVSQPAVVAAHLRAVATGRALSESAFVLCSPNRTRAPSSRRVAPVDGVVVVPQRGGALVRVVGHGVGELLPWQHCEFGIAVGERVCVGA
jgi:hypothetical protein